MKYDEPIIYGMKLDIEDLNRELLSYLLSKKRELYDKYNVVNPYIDELIAKIENSQGNNN